MDDSFSPEEFEKLKGINDDLRDSLDRLFILQSFPEEIANFSSKAEIFNSLLTLIPKIVNCYYCQVYLWERDEFVKVDESFYHPDTKVEPVESELLTWCCQREKVMVLPGLKTNEGRALVPLIKGTQTLGVLILQLGEYYSSFSELTNLTLTTLSNYTAYALDHLESVASIQRKLIRLEDQRNYIEGVLENVDCPIIALNPDGIVKLMNKKAEDFFEIRAKIALGNPYTVAMPTGFQSIFSELLLKIQSNHHLPPKKFSFTTSRGQKEVLMQASATKVMNSNRPGLVCVFQDLEVGLMKPSED